MTTTTHTTEKTTTFTTDCISDSMVKQKRVYYNAAPLNIPWKRRRQMLSIIIWLSMSLSMAALFLTYWTHPVMFPLAIIYMSWILLDRAPETGGRRIQWVREWSLWTFIAEYFPIKVIKEQDLDPKNNYLFGYHPHGILAFGAVSLFVTEGSGFSKLFPGIIPRLMTLSTNFRIPFYRELLLSMGFCSASRSSCESALKSGPGQSIAIVIGGAEEALTSCPGTNKLVLKRRLGFIRLAIRQQASLVPVFSFGESNLYDQYSVAKGSTIGRIQSFMKKWFGISAPLFYGRGIFNYDFGLIPYRRPVVIIVGKPISVPKMEEGQIEPSKEQILDVQAQYIKELTAIYDNYKDIYAKDRQQDLQIIA
ncbi:diacylglycerol acyltransferase [Halteromyces radiatus]|uniref:diacylglycerol acyltransferase n=1 Tax=Halteromyces radiatus TaxID=101107 RepID=UPI00221F64E7|nr:diacylglycerol acyltransferase [Halteromyces radiatus]KAI8099129.1 diacylglycerol acyltransferase [Halteromyces radiatus]